MPPIVLCLLVTSTITHMSPFLAPILKIRNLTLGLEFVVLQLPNIDFQLKDPKFNALSYTVKSQAVDWSTIQFWTLWAKGHST